MRSVRPAARRQAARKPPRDAGCHEPYLVAGRSTIDRLQDKLEVEGKLQFADDNDRRVVTAQRDKVTAPDLPFDGEAKFFEITFDG